MVNDMLLFLFWDILYSHHLWKWYEMKWYLQILSVAKSLTAKTGGSHSFGKNGATTYAPKLSAIIDTWAGLRINVDVHANKNAGIGPTVSYKYAYSAPDLGTRVPSSAYANAPVDEMMRNDKAWECTKWLYIMSNGCHISHIVVQSSQVQFLFEATMR